MFSYKLLNIKDCNFVDNENVQLVEKTNDYIELRKFLKEKRLYTTCKFHNYKENNETFIPLQLKYDKLPFTFLEHIWNTTAILSFENKGMLQKLSLPFSIFNVTDIYPDIVETPIEYRLLDKCKLFYVKDLRFKVVVEYNEYNKFEIIFKEINNQYRAYLLSDIPNELWKDILEEHQSEDIQIVGEPEIKYLDNEFFYLDYKIKCENEIINKEYYPTL